MQHMKANHIYNQKQLRNVRIFGQESAFFGTQIRTTVHFGQESVSDNSPITLQIMTLKYMT